MPPAPEKRELQELVRRLSALIKEQARESNRLKSGIESAVVKASIETNLEFLAAQTCSERSRTYCSIG